MALAIEIAAPDLLGVSLIPVKFGNNSITAELETFVVGLCVCRELLAMFSIIILTLRRQQLATVFNQLHKFWIR